jgi:hypothetical protein
MSFSNSVVGGVGNLVRDFIQSVGYAAGSAGWRISKDGTAEFNNASVRGSLLVGPAAPAQGAVQIGLTGTAIPSVLRNFSVDYTWLEADIRWINATDFFFLALVTNSVFVVTETVSGVYTVANGVQLQELTESTTANTVNHGSSVYDTARLKENWRLADVTFDSSSTVDAQGDWLWQSNSGGYEAAAGSTAGNVLTTASVSDVVLLTTGSGVFRNGFVYRAEIGIQAAGTGGNNSVVYSLHKNNLAGSRFLEFRAWHAVQGGSNSNNDHVSVGYFYNNTGADITAAIALCVKLNAGTNVQFGGGGINPIYMNVKVDRAYTAGTAPEAVPFV